MELSKLKAVSLENSIILFYGIELLQNSLLSWKKQDSRQRWFFRILFRKVEGEYLTALSVGWCQSRKLKEFSSINPQVSLQSRTLLTVMVGSGWIGNVRILENLEQQWCRITELLSRSEGPSEDGDYDSDCSGCGPHWCNFSPVMCRLIRQMVGMIFDWRLAGLLKRKYKGC